MTHKEDRVRYADLADNGRENALVFMVMANEWVTEMLAGERSNDPETRDSIKVLCAVAQANITVSNQLREHVTYLDACIVEDIPPAQPGDSQVFAFPTEEGEDDGEQQGTPEV